MGKSRSFGILMPISSLPSGEGIGTLGQEAYNFIDYIADAGAGIWQVLPLNPTNYGDSPYQSCSSDALNYYFIDLALLVKQRLLKKSEIQLTQLSETPRRVDYGKQFVNKTALLKTAFSRFKGGARFDKFVKDGEYADFATFMAIKESFGHVSWTQWDEPYRTYNEKVVEKFVEKHREEINFWHFTQYIFLQQWNKLKSYANARGVAIMGDIPLYVAYDSVEAWKYGKKLFKVDDNGNLSVVAGCPPDGFSADGQLWGNPIYNWQGMKNDGYKWWRARIENCFNHFDILRIDHFRGFDRYWEVPAGDTTAKFGYWQDGPKEELFKGMESYNIVAEDLGLIDEGVRRLMKNLGYPGMKILEFAFDGDSTNEHKPSNYTNNFVCYTGTHDNLPLRQYIEDLQGEYAGSFVRDLIYECSLLGVPAHVENDVEACMTVIELAFASIADTVIIPLWDLLALRGEARINLPSTVSSDNWSWRFIPQDFTDGLSGYLKRLSGQYNRVKKVSTV